MRINTRTDSLELTKPERKTLRDACSLLWKIEKHAEGPAQEFAAEGADAIGETLQALPPMENAPAV